MPSRLALERPKGKYKQGYQDVTLPKGPGIFVSAFRDMAAVLRGDYGRIEIGARTSIQDGTVVHCTAELNTVVGDRCVIGHLVHLEGCTVHDDALVGRRPGRDDLS